MHTISRSFGLLWDALFLQREAYETLRDDDNPFVEGLFILVIVGLVVGVVGAVGTLLEAASTPSITAIRDTVLRNLQSMPWWDMMLESGGQQAVDQFQSIWDMQWSFIGTFMPSALGAIGGIFAALIGLLLGWFVFGVLAHLLAKLFGGTGSFNQTLGTTALASAPQLLLLVGFLPFVVVAGVGTWTMLCRYMALRTTHDLSWSRAVWATVLPPFILGLLLTLLAFLGSLAFGAAMGAMFGGGS